ncbi:MAG TPA: DUF4157 domain-containing protein [Chthoniobacterales bacterium]|nr:DUF4157 domain-containing protein [Chthoniobacterales bacterium]
MRAALQTKPKASSSAFPTFTPVGSHLLQRKCACGGTTGPSGECESCRKKKRQRRSENLDLSSIGHPRSSVSEIPPIVDEVLRSPGQPLDSNTRAFMEPRFGHDFSQVRIHTDTRADESAQSINALAYTVGENMAFRAGHFRPATDSGRRLLAHELTHVLQQKMGHVGSKQTGTAAARIGANVTFEREADAWGERIVLDIPFSNILRAPQVSPYSLSGSMLAVQRQQSKDVAKFPETKTQTPLEQATELVGESPSTVKDRASWILKAADQGFVTFNTTTAKNNLQDVRDEKKVEKLDPTAAGYDVPILEVEVGLAKKIIQRWVDANGAGTKPSIQFGSMIRSSADPHGKGKAIDINALNMATSVDPTVTILNDLDKSIHASYGLGFPFQGDFFDPADNIETKKRAAERSAAPSVEAKTETSEAAVSKPATNALVAEKPAGKPVTAQIENALEKRSSHIWKASGTMGASGKWLWEEKDKIKQVGGGAYTRLKSQQLKDTLAARRKDGFSFVIFPDNDNHLHLDER